jgi:hypothetical protein
MIKRYKFAEIGGIDIKSGQVSFPIIRLEENKQGTWCWYDDVVKLEADNAALRADNAAMTATIGKAIDYLMGDRAPYDALVLLRKTQSKPSPGASLLQELEQLRSRLKAYGGFEPCDFKSLDAKNKGLEESMNSYKPLVPELLQLRKVRDAAEVLKNAYGKDSTTKMNAWHNLVDALAAKGVE